MTVMFSLIDPDNTEYALTTSETTWKRFLEELPGGVIGYPPIHYRTLTLPGKDGVVVEDVRLGERIIDIPLSLVAGDVKALLGSLKTFYQGIRVRRDLVSCKLKATDGMTSVYLDMRFIDEVWKELSGGISRKVVLRFAAANPYWHKGTATEVNLTSLSASTTYNRIAQRLFGESSPGWNTMNGGMNGLITALAIAPDGSIYAGGSFTTAGGNSAMRIAKWNGTTWYNLSTGVSGSVAALAVAPDGTLYAGGSFATAGGVTVNRIAKWDGTAWSALGTGMDNDITCIAIASDGTLYAGGNFTTAGGVNLNDGAALWNGYRWVGLDFDYISGAIGHSFAIVVSANYLVLGYASSPSTGTSFSSAVNIVNNTGSAVAPTLKLAGNSGTRTLVYFENATTQQKVWANYTIQNGEILTIDFEKSSVISSWKGDILNAIVPGSDLQLELAPGTNKILLYLTGSGTATATLSWTDHYTTLAEALG